MDFEQQQMEAPNLNNKDPEQLQLIEEWRQDIGKIENQLLHRYGQENLSTNIQKAFQLYCSACIPSVDLELVESQIQLRYPLVSIQSVVDKLYHYHQEQLIFSKHTDFIFQSIRESIQGKDPSNLIDHLHQYLNAQDHLNPNRDRQAIVEMQVQQSLALNQNDFFDQAYDYSPRHFTGVLVEKTTRKLKENMEIFTGQKKVVHVFTKKGYGLNVYREHLQQRKMNEKEWAYFQKEFIQNNRYDFYLSQAVFATVNTVIAYVKGLKEGANLKGPFSHPIDRKEFIQINESIYKMTGQVRKTLNDCLRQIFDLKTDLKVYKNQALKLFEELSRIRKQNPELKRKKIAESHKNLEQKFTSKDQDNDLC